LKEVPHDKQMPILAPGFIAWRKGKDQVAIDLRKFNTKSLPNAYPSPHQDGVLSYSESDEGEEPSVNDCTSDLDSDCNENELNGDDNESPNQHQEDICLLATNSHSNNGRCQVSDSVFGRRIRAPYVLSNPDLESDFKLSILETNYGIPPGFSSPNQVLGLNRALFELGIQETCLLRKTKFTTVLVSQK
jgi:hypothetical protein